MECGRFYDHFPCFVRRSDIQCIIYRRNSLKDFFDTENFRSTVIVIACVAVVAFALGLSIQVCRMIYEKGAGSVLRDPATISVSGSSSIHVSADTATFTVSAEAVEPTSEEARMAVARMMNEAVANLRNGLGVTDEDLETGWISINPYYEWVDGQRTLRGQKASQSVTVKTGRVDRAGEVYEILAKTDGISVSSISLDKEDKTEARAEARRKAVESARAKAQNYADALGIEIVGVMSVTDSTSQGSSPYYSNAVMFKTASADYAEGSGTELYAGDVVVTESVDIVFSIR